VENNLLYMSTKQTLTGN